jgi:hypothetical protein
MARTSPLGLLISDFWVMLTLCIDTDHAIGHTGANANVADLGKRSAKMKAGTIQFVTNLWTSSEGTRIHCQLLSVAAEQHFESCVRMTLISEYSAPYALSLDSIRDQSTLSGLTQLLARQPHDEEDVFISMNNENKHKQDTAYASQMAL